MKVILSVDAIKFPLTGIGRYTFELAKGLQKANLDHLAFMRGYQLLEGKDDPSWDFRPGLEAWKKTLVKNQAVLTAFQMISPILKKQTLAKASDHIFHGPNYYLPPFDGPSVVTIHDLSIYLWPESHPKERVRHLSHEIEKTLQRTSAIITDTHYTRAEVAQFFSFPIERIHAVPLACSAEFQPRTHAELAPVLQHYNLEDRNYVLFIGTIEPRKNISTLIDAYAQLPQAVKLRYPLVIIGHKGWKSDEIHTKMKKAEREGWLRYLGFVPGDALPVILSGARLFCFPSLYEGFGLPVLEAMASGVPVIASNASTLPEVGGSAALYHDPNDVDDLVELLKKGLEDTTWQGDAITQGIARAKEFSWQRCTDETIDIYRKIKQR